MLLFGAHVTIQHVVADQAAQAAELDKLMKPLPTGVALAEQQPAQQQWIPLSQVQ